MVWRRLEKAMWNRSYRSQARWDLDGPDPVLVQVLDRRGIRGPGRAIDLGCGSGENAIELARRGFTTVGVDWAERAIAEARRKAAREGVPVDFRVADITSPTGVEGAYDLVFDRLVFLPLGRRARRAYAGTLSRLAQPGGHALLLEPVLVEAPPFPSLGWLGTKLKVLTLLPGEIERHVEGAFSMEVALRKRSSRSQGRALTSSRVEDYTAFWLTRKE